MKMDGIEQFLQCAPWHSVPDTRLHPMQSVPTMLSPDEQRLYYWLTAHWTRDRGEVVELGSYVGGSTARLAAGLHDTKKLARVFAFDHFRTDERTKSQVLYRQGIKPFEGEDILPLSKALLSKWQERIVWRPGPIEQSVWEGGPIELLVMDASKKDMHMDRMAEIFFPHLIPGKSLLVQQDFYHWRLPWITAQMQRMRRWFKPLAYCPNDTVVFLNTRQIDDEALAAGRISPLSDQEIAVALRRMNGRGIPWHKAFRIRKMIRVMQANPGVRTGWKMKDVEAPRPTAATR